MGGDSGPGTRPTRVVWVTAYVRARVELITASEMQSWEFRDASVPRSDPSPFSSLYLRPRLRNASGYHERHTTTFTIPDTFRYLSS